VIFICDTAAAVVSLLSLQVLSVRRYVLNGYCKLPIAATRVIFISAAAVALLLLQVLSVRRNVLNGSAQGVEWCHNLVHLDLSVSAAAAAAAAAATAVDVQENLPR
jgi:hypothetical protein